MRHALALYLVTDFGRFHSRNPDIIDLAFRIDRTPSAVALKLSNLAALDESLPQKGMANASKMDRQIWAEFLGNPDGVLKAWEHQTMPPPATTSPDNPFPGMAEPVAEFDFTGAGERRVETTVLERIGCEWKQVSGKEQKLRERDCAVIIRNHQIFAKYVIGLPALNSAAPINDSTRNFHRFLSAD